MPSDDPFDKPWRVFTGEELGVPERPEGFQKGDGVSFQADFFTYQELDDRLRQLDWLRGAAFEKALVAREVRDRALELIAGVRGSDLFERTNQSATNAKALHEQKRAAWYTRLREAKCELAAAEDLQKTCETRISATQTRVRMWERLWEADMKGR